MHQINTCKCKRIWIIIGHIYHSCSDYRGFLLLQYGYCKHHIGIVQAELDKHCPGNLYCRPGTGIYLFISCRSECQLSIIDSEHMSCNCIGHGRRDNVQGACDKPAIDWNYCVHNWNNPDNKIKVQIGKNIFIIKNKSQNLSKIFFT